MNLHEAFQIALRSLKTNRLRSALTTLGIIIGVSAVIALVRPSNGRDASARFAPGPSIWSVGEPTSASPAVPLGNGGPAHGPGRSVLTGVLAGVGLPASSA